MPARRRRARSETPNNSGRTGSLAEISTGGHARRVRWLPPSKPSQIVAYYASDADPTRQIGGFAELLAGC